MVKLSDNIAPHFKEAHQCIKADTYSEYWLSGGRASTKTSFFALEIILGIIKDPEVNAVIIRKVKDTMRDSVYANILWAIETLGVDEYFHLNTSPLQVTYKPTGQSIKFRGLDDPEKVKGIKFVRGYPKFIWFEELTEFRDMNEIRSVQQSLERGTNAKFVTMFSYNPPKNRASWVNKEQESRPPYRYTLHSDYRTVPKDWLGTSFLEKAEYMRLHKPEAYNHEYLGISTGNDELLVFNSDYSTRTFDTPLFSELTGGRPFYGADWGFSQDPTTLVRCFVKNNDLYIEYETGGVGVDNDELPQLFSAVPLSRKFKIFADCARPETISHVRNKGYNIEGAPKWSGSVEDGVTVLKSFNHIYIHPRCVRTLEEFSNYSYKVDRVTGEVLPVIIDKFNHYIDAIRYGLTPLIKRKQSNRIHVGEFVL